MALRRPGLALGAVAIVAAAVALWAFPRSIPLLTLGQRLTRQTALAQADSFFRVHDLAPEGARTAVHFQAQDSLLTYVDLVGGGRDALNALARRKDVALFAWTVRAFLPQDPHEARVSFATDGRVVGFRRVFADADARPDVGEEAARALADDVLGGWLGLDPTSWRFATSSYVTLEASGRVDRTYTFEMRDFRVTEAPVRIDVTVAGDTPSQARPYVVIPESFRRRYGEMRSANDLLALIAQVGMLGLFLIAAMVLRHYSLRRSVRWLPALAVGGVIGVLVASAGLNELPGSWFAYDTATSPATFEAQVILRALLSGAGTALIVGLTLAAAEAAARHAFPAHLDWWKAWAHPGAQAVAGRVATGYVVALVAFAYVASFYLVTRSVFGWWVPSELLDDPNLISTPAPWLSGISTAVQAGVWEEALFRALPLSLLWLWARGRAHPRRWMVAGVVATALVFGFAHSNYPSWPPYSRGIEIFLDACLWGALVVWLGALVTMLAHFTYDLVLFGLFAASGSAPAYRVSAVVLALAVLAPGLAVAWTWIRQRSFSGLPPEATFGAWSPAPAPEREALAAPGVPLSLGSTARRAALVMAGAAALLAIVVPGTPTLGRAYTVSRQEAVAAADVVAGEHGVDPAAWRRLSTTATDGSAGVWSRFLVQEGAEDIAPRVATTYEPPAWWVVRYVHSGGTAAERAEEWRIRLWPDGSVLDWRHVVPDSAAGRTVSDEDARRIALGAIVGAGLDTHVLRESKLEATEREARRDVTVTYTDTAATLPGDAIARVSVPLAGDQPLVVRRSVEIPETFLRADRQRRGARSVISLVCGALLFILVAAGTVLVIRRRPPLLHDGVLGRGASVRLLLLLALFLGLDALNGLPGRLFPYNTAMPWTNWVGINVVGLGLAVVLPPLVFLGLWLTLNALRRRVGVPLLPSGPEDDRKRDVLLAGLGLGATLSLLPLVLRLADRGGFPSAPDTLLDRAIPLLGAASQVPLDTVLLVIVLAVPALVVVGIAQSRTGRLLFAALLAALLLVLFMLGSTPDPHWWVRAGVATAAGLLAAWVSLRWWARYAGWSWVVGGIVAAGFDGLGRLAHASTFLERGAEGVALAVALVLLSLAAQVAGPSSGVFHEAGGTLEGASGS